MIPSLALSFFAAAALLAGFGRRLRRTAVWLALAPSVAAAATLLAHAPRVLDGEPVRESISWVPSLGVSLEFSLDGAALAMGLVVSLVGAAILAYTVWYQRDPIPLLGRLNLFAGAMFGLTVSDNLFGLFVFWELTTIVSYSLIAYDDRSPDARKAGVHALFVTALGGLVMLVGFVVLGTEAGTYRISEIAAAPPSGPAVTAALALVLAGVLTKSAQVPFHGWLPAAMAAPTPASAFLHAATMVKAGVFLAIRLAPVAMGNDVWQGVLLTAGIATMAVGGWAALRERDLKRILAYGTVAQLGLLTVLAASEATVAASVALLLAHAGFKAALFMVVGSIDKATGTRDIRELGGLRRTLPGTWVVAVAAAASMAGIPLTLGFVAKEAALDALLAASPAIAAAVAAGAVLTVAYTTRILGVFWGPERTAPSSSPAPGMTAAAALLAAAGVAFGIAPGPVEALSGSAARAAGAAAVALPAWPGPKPALWLSLGSLAAGWLAALLPIGPRRGTAAASAAFDATVDGVLGFARRATAVLQNGSLPVYLAVILATVVAVPGAALVTAAASPAGLVPAESWLQAAVGAAAAAAAVGLLALRNRLGAILLLGVVGYGMAGLFALQGAPDLALTQVLVETVTLVVFALVLGRLPERFDRPARPAVGAPIRVALALAVGVFVTGAMLSAAAGRADAPVSEAYLERSLDEGYGRNVVNVILTDFRALDTFGEIAVVATAAIGVAGLAAGIRGRSER
ncbi:MAG: DUF4040 domain-containing protein [Actinobacteria bacterium]|nr:DUF4040 domain-containing protein [Actinomycetota bacterium]